MMDEVVDVEPRNAWETVPTGTGGLSREVFSYRTECSLSSDWEDSRGRLLRRPNRSLNDMVGLRGCREFLERQGRMHNRECSV